MPTLYNFYVVAPEYLTAPLSIEAIQKVGALWGQIEARMFDGFDRIDRIFGRRVTGHQLGVFSRAEAIAMRDDLASATPDMLATIEAESLVARTYQVLLDTTAEAARRGACMAIRLAGDDEDLIARQRDQEDAWRREDDEAAARARENPQGPHDALARAFLRALLDRELVELAGGEDEVVDDLAAAIAMHGATLEVAPELAAVLLRHNAVAEVFADDAELVAALRDAVGER